MAVQEGGSPDPFMFDRGAPTGVLLIHGFSGSPAEMRGMGESLAAQGYTVHGLLVPGHGTKPEDMLGVKWRDWVAACGQALEQLHRSCPEVFVAGLSNGALLSLYLAATARRQVAGVISMSAPIYWTDWRARAVPVLKYAIRWHNKGAPQDRDPSARERLWHYPRFPTAALAELNALQGECRRLLPRLQAPLLVMQGRHDTTAVPGCADYIYNHAGSADKEKVLWENSGHVITEDTDRWQVWERALRFIAARQKVRVAQEGDESSPQRRRDAERRIRNA